MQKLMLSLFFLSFLLLALALIVVPTLVHQHISRYIMQAILIVLAVAIDMVALRLQKKQSQIAHRL